MRARCPLLRLGRVCVWSLLSMQEHGSVRSLLLRQERVCAWRPPLWLGREVCVRVRETPVKG